MKQQLLARCKIICFFVTIALVGKAQTTTEKINWPAKYDPSVSKFYVHNEIEINANAAVVWSILIDALKWESWYSGAKNVKLTDSTSKVLDAHSIFIWETMGLKFRSIIKEFKAGSLLAWESNKPQIQGYHVWLIVPTKNGCKVITDESQNGWLTFFEKTFQRKKLKRLHNIWLNGIKVRSEQQQSTQNEIEH